jgi:RNA polymerase sigma factor (sigma-70 family)
MTEGATSGETRDGGEFPVTRWTRVLAAKGNSTEAKSELSDLCAAYYGPVRAFIGHTVRDVDAATVEDLAQEFFAKLLGKSGVDGVERGRGKFRSYLLGAVKHFVADWRDREGAAKRGGGREIVSLDEVGGEMVDEKGEVGDASFDREWAMTILDRAMGAVAKGYAESGKEKQFAVLKGWLTGDAVGLSQADAAAELGISEGAVKVAVHRLRKKFREGLKQEIGETVGCEGDVGEELRYLVEVLVG